MSERDLKKYQEQKIRDITARKEWQQDLSKRKIAD